MLFLFFYDKNVFELLIESDEESQLKFNTVT
jgi:hypothetical protein